MSLPLVRLCRHVHWLTCVLLLAYAASVHADPKPLSKEEQAKVDKAIDKGVAYLKRMQTREGDWPRNWPSSHLVGQCALPAYALLEAGVSADDPVIQKAADFLRPKVLKNDWTYEISLAILFFDRLGDPKDKKLIQSLALRLIASQHRTGGWSYRCLTVSGENETALLKSLEELSKQMKDGDKSAGEAIRVPEVPRALRSLTIFQNPKKLEWVERSRPNERGTGSLRLAGLTDNSNTQFGMLALWVAQRHGIPMERTFALLVERFERTQGEDGWWPYPGGHFIGPHRKGGAYPYRSMICVGLLGLAIGGGLKLSAPGANLPDQEHVRILRGLAALYQEIGTPAGQMKRSVPPQDLYFLWSVERVGMLYDLPAIGDKDWYRWGAEILITNQKAVGDWSDPPRNPKYFVSNYGVTLNTAFALLFLKHSHPMKELTQKLPYKAKDLNRGVARLLTGAPPLEPSTITPSRGDKPDR